MIKLVLCSFVVFGVEGCASQPYYEPEGNITPSEYQHVSGVKIKRNATEELVYIVASAAGTASGHIMAGGSVAPSVVPKVSQKALLNIKINDTNIDPKEDDK